MQGKVSGVQIIDAGKPGDNVTIKIRGLGTINNSNPVSYTHRTKPDGHAEIRTEGKVPYAYIRNSYIMQKLEDFRLVPEYRHCLLYTSRCV